MNTKIIAARRRATEILDDFGVKRLPVPIRRIARRLGIHIDFTPLDGELSGMAFVKNGKKFVAINALHHPNRQHFTLAHEIGHHELHAALLNTGVHVDKAVLRRDPTSAKGIEAREVEANQFASELLMPGYLLQKLVDEEFQIDDDDAIEALASKLQVSTAALQYRLLRR